MTWVKGQSGNPSGKARVDAATLELRDLARKHSARAIARIAELMDDPDGQVALKAAGMLLERGFGKPDIYPDTPSAQTNDERLAREMMRDPDGRRALDALAAAQARLARDAS